MLSVRLVLVHMCMCVRASVLVCGGERVVRTRMHVC